MILKHIYLYLNLLEYPDLLVTPFGFQTRYVCNFLERRLKGRRFKAERFSKICIQGRNIPRDACPIVSVNAAVPEVHFDRVRYENLRGDQFHEFFLEMLEHGLRKCRAYHVIPLNELLVAIDDFRAGGYRNEWMFRAKKLRRFGLKASLKCDLTMTEFVLTLSLAKDGVVIYSKPILRTKPDEIIFGHQFKDITEADDKLIVSNAFGETMYELPLSELVVG